MIQPPLIELNADAALRLARILQDARTAQSLSIQAVAKNLLLSRMQVVGLETGIAKSFYSARIYAQAARKYCAYLNVDFNVDELLVHPRASTSIVIDPLEAPVSTVSDTALLAETAAPASRGESRPRGAYLWMATSLLLAAALFYSQRANLELLPSQAEELIAGAISKFIEKPATNQAEEVAETEEKNDPETDERAERIAAGNGENMGANAGGPQRAADAEVASDAVERVSEKADPKIGGQPNEGSVATEFAPGKLNYEKVRLEFSKPSWVEAIYFHGKVVNRLFHPGQELTLESEGLKSLVIGHYSGVKAYSQNKPINMATIRPPKGDVVTLYGKELAEILQTPSI